jgi:hypothetical protein
MVCDHEIVIELAAYRCDLKFNGYEILRETSHMIVQHLYDFIIHLLWRNRDLEVQHRILIWKVSISDAAITKYIK